MVDIIYRHDDHILDRRLEGEELIELPSGARQRRREALCPDMAATSVTGQCELRRRKHHKNGEAVKQKESECEELEGEKETLIPSLLKAGNLLAGLLVMVFLSYHYSCYLYMLHENDLWFSEIMVC